MICATLLTHKSMTNFAAYISSSWLVSLHNIKQSLQFLVADVAEACHYSLCKAHQGCNPPSRHSPKAIHTILSCHTVLCCIVGRSLHSKHLHGAQALCQVCCLPASHCCHCWQGDQALGVWRWRRHSQVLPVAPTAATN